MLQSRTSLQCYRQVNQPSENEYSGIKSDTACVCDRESDHRNAALPSPSLNYHGP